MARFVLLRDLLIAALGVWYFEFHLDFTLPGEDNLLLFFVAIPIIWATVMQSWTSTSYAEMQTPAMFAACHALAVVLLAASVFLISAVLNTIEASLSPLGNVLFHGVGWSALAGIIFYDVVDAGRA